MRFHRINELFHQLLAVLHYLRDFLAGDVIQMYPDDCADRPFKPFAQGVSRVTGHGIILVPEPGDDGRGRPVFRLGVIRYGHRAEMSVLIEEIYDEVSSNPLNRKADPGTAAAFGEQYRFHVRTPVPAIG